MAFFHQKKAEGDHAESLFIHFLIRSNFKIKKGIELQQPYDYIVLKEPKSYNIEIKKYGRPELQTIFAETLQISKKNKKESIPEYLKHTEDIDWIIYVDVDNLQAFIYDVKVFASYVRANMHMEKTIAYGTARGIIIPECCQEAGFKKKIYIGE
jgi:hypothetical protein